MYQVIGYKIRLYADSFNRLELKRSAQKSKFILLLLVFNVASLASQAIFLHADSKDIDSDFIRKS